MDTVGESTVFSWLKSHPEALTKYINGQNPPAVEILEVPPICASFSDIPFPGGHSSSLLCSTPKGGRKNIGLRKISIQGLPSQDEISLSKKSTIELRNLPQTDMLMELVRDIAYDLDVDSLSHKILTNVNVITYADRSSLFLVEGDENNTFLISRLFDVTENSTVAESIHNEEESIKIPFGVGIIGHAAKEGQPINIKDAYEDSRFNQAVDQKTGYRTKSILCMPIKSHMGEVIGVAQVMNKSNGDAVFTKDDEKVFSNYLTFCGIGLTNARLYQRSIWEYRRNQVLLQLAHGLFEEQTTMDRMVERIMMETQELVSCEKCYVVLLDQEEKEEVVFSRIYSKTPTSGGKQIEVKVLEGLDPPNRDLTKTVVATGETVSISYWKETPMQLDEGIRNVICIPIYSSAEEIIGVAQVANKDKDLPFTKADQESLEMFAVFCGLGIHNVLMYEKISKALAKQKVALDVLSYHASATEEEAGIIATSEIPKAAAFNLEAFCFDDRPLTDTDTVMAAVRMFMDTGLVTRFNISKKVLCRWVLTVKKNYRKVIYHNWRHAFNVAQTMFAMMKEGQLNSKLSDSEKLSLLVACFCHDLDHRGTNNAFQSKVESPIAQLYSTSTMEHHHFDHCIMIINSEGNNILQNLTTDEYSDVLEMLEFQILSTDLALYFQKNVKFFDLIERKCFNWSDNSQRELLRSMLMTACDVAAITKPWEIQREVAMLVATEFFEQGDRERSELNQEPVAMMDRQNQGDLPLMQIGFIDGICAPLYKELLALHPPLKPLHDGVMNNRGQWNVLLSARRRANAAAAAAAARVSPPDMNGSMAREGEEGGGRRSVHYDGTAVRPIEAWKGTPNAKDSAEEDGNDAGRQDRSGDDASSRQNTGRKCCSIM